MLNQIENVENFGSLANDFFVNAPFGIIITSSDFIIYDANELFCQILGVKSKDIKDKSLKLFSANKEIFLGIQKCLLCYKDNYTYNHKPLKGKMRFACLDKYSLLCNVSISFIVKSNACVRIIWFIEEVSFSDYEIIDKSFQDFFECFFYDDPMISIVVNPIDGKIINVNPSAVEFYGYSRELIRSMHIWEIDVHGKKKVQEQMESLCKIRQRNFHSRHRLFSGLERDVYVYSGVITLSGGVLLLLHVVDDTDRINSEVIIRRQTEDLQRSNSELEQFSYVASHDLRQPLRVVFGYISLLEELCNRIYCNNLKNIDDDLYKEYNEYMFFIKNAVERMDRLIVDILDYSRIGRRQNIVDIFSLYDIICEAVFDLNPLIQETKAVISIQDNMPNIQCHKLEIVRLFQNLIENAIKYRHPDRVSIITISSYGDIDKYVVCVEDNGIGIESCHFDRIFGIFQRLHNYSEYNGTGIGLAICKKIIEHHKGKIWVESTPGIGAKFLFTLSRIGKRSPAPTLLC
ncbi:hypothetical protein CCP2SC5_50071 [Azospirillaceae bacterium]